VKRLMDLAIAALALVVFAIPMVAVAFVIWREDGMPILHWSRRIGQNNEPILMPKFRSMLLDTPDVATHLLEDPDRWLLTTGRFIRRTSLDELPQLWSVLRGHLSLVGPRPALFNQSDLIELRTAKDVQRMKPGVTGLAQVRGRDELSISEKVALDAAYMERQSLWLDFKILFETIAQVVGSRGIRH